MRVLKAYIDTSVVGGCYDPEFEVESRAFFRMVRDRRLVIIVSTLLADELRLAPPIVQAVVIELPIACVQSVELDEEALQLRDAYMAAEVVGPARSNDALHVALATVARADMIVSWNFKHIVHFDKIRGFGAVNLREGYTPIDIRSPKEIV